jgi:hypothetical protein
VPINIGRGLMRDITDLLKQEKPQEQMTDEEIVKRVLAEDAKMINTFGRHESPRVRWGIGRRWK